MAAAAVSLSSHSQREHEQIIAIGRRLIVINCMCGIDY